MQNPINLQIWKLWLKSVLIIENGKRVGHIGIASYALLANYNESESETSQKR